MPKAKRKYVTIVVIALFLVGGGFFFLKAKNGSSTTTAVPTPKPAPPVNQIPFDQRPYVTLQPLVDRNMLELSIDTLPLKAKTVEVALEYDRNKGVLDAVLKNFTLDTIPYQDKLFLGSKSAGGHITYHEDVVGGKVTLTFDGDGNRYALEDPWRYDDTQASYTELSTADAKFQVVFDKPFKTPKVVIMQSPGMPAPLDGQGSVVAGPYLIRGVGDLPDDTMSVTIHSTDDLTGAKLMGWDGKTWTTYPSSAEGRNLTATAVPLTLAYIVAK